MERLAKKSVGGMKFRHQLTLIFVIGILVMALITSVAVSNISSQIFRDRQIEQGLQVADSLAKQGELALLYQSRESAKVLVDNALNFPGVKSVTVYTETGVVLYSSKEQAEQLDSKPEQVKLSHEDKSSWVFVAPVLAGESQDNIWSEFDSAQPEREELLGYIYLQVGKDTAILMEQSILRSNLLISLVVAVILLLMLLGISR
ncbi:MAG: hypothetical protein EP323_00460, partial [Gammaproteobacteria bacterium]